MGLGTVPFRKIEERTEDIFEAVTVIARRARQIIGDRYVIEEERRREEENLEEIGGENDYSASNYSMELDIDTEAFDAVEKPTSQGLDEFLAGDLEWDKQKMFDGANLEDDNKDSDA